MADGKAGGHQAAKTRTHQNEPVKSDHMVLQLGQPLFEVAVIVVQADSRKMLAEPPGFGAAAGGFETVEKENWSRSQGSYEGMQSP